MPMPTFEDIHCPACSYKPPDHFPMPAQHKALERHVNEKLSSGDGDHLSFLNAIVMKNDLAQQFNKLEGEKMPPVDPKNTVQQEEKKEEKVSVQQRPTTTTKTTPIRSIVSESTPEDKKARIDRRVDEWGTYLYNDFNPLLVATTKQLAGIPDAWMAGGPGPDGNAITIPIAEGKLVTFWNPPLKDQLRLSESDCKKIAKAGANFAESPMGQAITAWLEVNAGLLALASALAVAGSYGWKVMRIKTEVSQLKEVIEAQNKMAQPQPATNSSEAA